MSKESLIEAIRKQNAKICVIGLGQVGLPTALTFSEAGFDVTGYDINEKLLSTLNSKKAPYEENNLETLLKSCMGKGRFSIISNFEESVRKSDVIIVCVSTPLTNDVKPDLSYIEKVCQSLSGLSLKNKIVIIESSIPPGTFAGLVLPLLGRQNKFGVDFWSAFVPERLAPGQAFSEIRETPRIIGHIDEESGIIAKALYEKIVSSEILMTPVQIAEVSKLVENTYRDVNIAFANEVGLICEKYDIDVVELIRVCNSHPRVKLLQPGPGVGGPCLPKDPYLLLNPGGNLQIESRIILESRKINDNMPYHVVSLLADALEEQNKRLSETTVLILGTAYKANVSDTRLSPAREIITQLIKSGTNVFVYDPKTDEKFGGKQISKISDVLAACDAVLLVTDHDEFKKIDVKEFQKMKKKPILVDTRRIFQKNKVETLGIHYLSIGYVKSLKNK